MQDHSPDLENVLRTCLLMPLTEQDCSWTMPYLDAVATICDWDNLARTVNSALLLVIIFPDYQRVLVEKIRISEAVSTKPR